MGLSASGDEWCKRSDKAITGITSRPFPILVNILHRYHTSIYIKGKIPEAQNSNMADYLKGKISEGSIFISTPKLRNFCVL